MKRREQKIRAWAVVFWLFVWQAAAMLLRALYPHGALLLASPLSSLARLLSLAATKTFWQSVGTFLLSCALAVMLAALSARFRRAEELLAPLVAVVKAVPVASFVILALVWLPSRGLAFFISALMVFPPVYLNVLEGIKRTDAALLEMARVFRVPFSRTLRGIYLPQVRGAGPLLEGGHGGGGHRPERRHDRRAALYREGILRNAGSLCVDGGDRAAVGGL